MSILPLPRKPIFGNDKYIEANAQALEALRHILIKYYLSIISHCVKHIDLSRATDDNLCGEGTLGE